MSNKPEYEKDDGPLTDEQLAAIREASGVEQVPDDSFTMLDLDGKE